jgi:hypothetical protein
MPLEPLHHCGIGALEIRARDAVSRAFDANERRGHARHYRGDATGFPEHGIGG